MDRLLLVFIFFYCIHSVDKLKIETYLHDAKKDSKPTWYSKGGDENFFEKWVFWDTPYFVTIFIDESIGDSFNFINFALK